MKRAAFLLALSSLAMTLPLGAQSAASSGDNIPQPVFLWPSGAPGALGHAEADRPRFYPFLPPNRSANSAVLVIPGGGYQNVALGYEGFQIAQWLNAQGIAAFVLDYRVAPYKNPIEIEDGMRAMRYIRAHASEYKIDPDRLGVWGSSAGGHLASTLGTQCDLGNAAGVPTDTDNIDQLDCRPDFMVLAYPVVTMKPPVAHKGSRDNLLGPDPAPEMIEKFSNELNVDAKTPPTFLFATTNDPVVPVENSLDFYRALERAKVPAELHLYDYPNHGCGLCGEIPELATWPTLLRNWLIHIRVIPADAPAAPAPGPNMPSWPQGFHGPGEIR